MDSLRTQVSDIGDERPVPSDEVQAFLDGLPPQASLSQRSPAEWRAAARESLHESVGDVPVVASVAELNAGGVRCRLYRPTGDESCVLVWLHGGGWVMGDLDSYDAFARVIASQASCAVLCVDYRLAPEHPFPAAIDDAWAATLWASEEFESVAVGGDSSGGNLAAAVSVRARDENILLAVQLLVYPIVDYAPDSSCYAAFIERYESFGGREGYGAACYRGLQRIWEQYVPDPLDRSSPYASPMRALPLNGLAPALMITAEHDLMRGQDEEYAYALDRAGVPVKVVNYAGQIHGFFNMPGVFDTAADAIAVAASTLREAFADRAATTLRHAWSKSA